MYSTSSALARPIASCHAKPGLAARALAALALWRSRRQLAALDQHQLDDLGISAKAAQAEANRPIWDVPAHWIN